MSGAFALSWRQHNFNLPGLVFWGAELLLTPLKITEGASKGFSQWSVTLG